MILNLCLTENFRIIHGLTDIDTINVSMTKIVSVYPVYYMYTMDLYGIWGGGGCGELILKNVKLWTVESWMS